MVLYCLFLVSVSMTFHLMYVQIVLVRSRLLNGQLYGELPARLTLSSLCIMSICNFNYFQ